MRLLAVVVAACSAPAAPVVSNTRTAPPAPAVTCGAYEEAVRCFATRAACAAELANCAEVAAPRWSCARSTATGMTSGPLDLCLPTPALCEHDLKIEEAHREPCRSVPEVYCRGGSELICHPTRAICEQEAKTLVSFGGDPSACTRY